MFSLAWVSEHLVHRLVVFGEVMESISERWSTAGKYVTGEGALTLVFAHFLSPLCSVLRVEMALSALLLPPGLLLAATAPHQDQLLSFHRIRPSNRPFLSEVALVMGFYHSNRKFPTTAAPKVYKTSKQGVRGESTVRILYSSPPTPP